MSRLLRLAEKGFVILSILFYTNVTVAILNGGVLVGRDSVTRLLAYAVQFATLFLVILWHKKIIRVVIQEKWLWLVVGLAAVSVLWSDLPLTTIRSNQNLMRTTLFGVYLGARYSLKEQVRLLAWAFGLGTLLSLVCILVLPSYGVTGKGILVDSTGRTLVGEIVHEGAWKGVYGHKNSLGRAMVLSALIFINFVPYNQKYRWIRWIGVSFAALLIFGSTSKTSLAMLLILIALLPLYKALRWNNTLVVPFFISIILVGGSFVLLTLDNLEAILAAFGRDPTLTGRTDLWAAVLEKIQERPWLGYGYGGFWQGRVDNYAFVWDVIGWQPQHSHNGFLDLLLDLGWLGLSAFILSYIAVSFRALTWVRQSKTAEGLWPITYLTFLFLANLTESSIFRQNFTWILYVAVALSMHSRSVKLSAQEQLEQQKVKERKIKQLM